jgi:hypothetical protein
MERAEIVPVTRTLSQGEASRPRTEGATTVQEIVERTRGSRLQARTGTVVTPR